MRKIRPRSRAVKKSEESQRVLDALDVYLEGNIDEPVRWLVRFWQDQAAVMLYREAYNHGADAFVREAVTVGNLPEMEKEWSTALDGHVCASCAALEGTKIGMDDEFKTVSGRREITTSIPPLHPRCKCAVKYVRVKNENIQ